MTFSEKVIYGKEFNMNMSGSIPLCSSCSYFSSLVFDLSVIRDKSLCSGFIANGTSFRSQIFNSSLDMVHANNFSALEPSFDTLDVRQCRANRLKWQTGSFRNVNFFDCASEESQYIDCKFSSVKFQECTLTADYFRECTFNNVSFENTTLDGVRFRACDLRAVNWSKVHLVNCTFENCHLSFECMNKAADMQGLEIDKNYKNGTLIVSFVPC